MNSNTAKGLHVILFAFGPDAKTRIDLIKEQVEPKKTI